MKITFISKLNNLQSEYQSNHHKATYSKKQNLRIFIYLNNVSEKWDQRASTTYQDLKTNITYHNQSLSTHDKKTNLS